jgi:glycosyl hydrolase family 35
VFNIPIEIIPDKGLKIDDSYEALISGSFHYWRHPVSLWEDILDKLKPIFNIICTYIPWSVHEVEPGVFNFSGNKNINKFLSLVHEKGLKIIVRPGPQINSELTYFGYPARILQNKENLSLDLEGNPVCVPTFPRFITVPSNTSSKFYIEVGKWFDAIDEILKEHIYPNGPIIAVQSDNENSFMFRTGFLEQDYSEDSIKLYHSFLKKKYSTIERVKQLYKQEINSFEEIQPPKVMTPDSLPNLRYYLDWISYKEYYLIFGLQEFVKMHKNRGIDGVIWTHNKPWDLSDAVFNTVKTESSGFIDIEGPDGYPGKDAYLSIKDWVSYCSQTSVLPFIPEFECGTFPLMYFSTGSSARTNATNFLATLMSGIKGINFYMFVDRDRWLDCPIAQDGRVRNEYYDFYQKSIAAVRKSGLLHMKRVNNCLLLKNRDYTRLMNVMSILPTTPINILHQSSGLPANIFYRSENFTFKDVIQYESDNVRKWAFNALTRLIIPFTQAGTEKLIGKNNCDKNLEDFEYVFTESFDFMSREVQESLVDYVKQGGNLIIGPRVPHLDSYFEPCEVLSEILYDESSIESSLSWNEIQLRDVGIFDKKDDMETLFEVNSMVIAYKRKIGSKGGTISHYGFLPPYTECKSIDLDWMAIILKILPLTQFSLNANGNLLDVSLFLPEAQSWVSSPILFIANYGNNNLIAELELGNIVSWLKYCKNEETLNKFGDGDFSVKDLISGETWVFEEYVAEIPFSKNTVRMLEVYK